MPFKLNINTLKSRMAVAVVVLVLSATSLVSLVSLSLAEREMRSIVGAQQVALLASAAAHIDADLRFSKALLAQTREQLAVSSVRSPAELQAFLEAHETLRDGFFNVLVFDPSGRVIANLNDRRAIRTQDFSRRPYFVDTLRIREGVISQPFKSLLSGKPVVLVTEPVFDEQGTLLYMLGGSIDLQRPRFFGQLEALKFGQSGYLFMLTGDGTIIHHPDRERILRNVHQERGGVVKPTLAALGGFEGWTEGRTKDDVPALMTYKRLRQTDWIIGAVYPLAEAFTPLIDMQRKAQLGAALVALISGLAGWLLILRLLRPLGALGEHVAAIGQGSVNIEVFNVARQDEFGELSRAFYRLSLQRRAVEREMAALARTDALTGIANRRMFEEVFSVTLARSARMQHWIGLAYLDIDHFKAINDTRGHATGDAVLVEFARRLRQAVRSTDTVARLAGDEFVVLFECMADDGAPEALAQKIMESIRSPFVLDGGNLRLTTSIGVALARGGWATTDAILGAADQALYEAKSLGRNTHAVYRLTMPAFV